MTEVGKFYFCNLFFYLTNYFALFSLHTLGSTLGSLTQPFNLPPRISRPS